MPSSSSPPPLPETLSSRLLSTIDPQTGACRLHPAVKLCELVQNNSRWVVRRKICYKCGSRSGNGKFHKPGVSVKNGVVADGVKSSSSRSERRLSGASRTRSVSASRGGMSSSRGLSEDVRARSVSRERSSSCRRLGGGTRARLSSRDTLMIVPAATAAVTAAPVIHHPTAAVVHPQPIEKEEEQAQEEDFDESDPIIYIPALSPHEELPPPPPRTEEEAERHAERLEMRKVHDTTGKKKKSSPTKAPVAEHKAFVKSNTHKMDNHSEPAGIVVHKTATTHKASAAALEPPSMPSAAAMALLESHGKNDNKDKRYANNNKNTHQHQEEEDEASETSSISTASAKMYQLEPDELHSKHPELAGVDPPHLEPPKQIIPSRNRSISRSRSKKGEQVKKISVDPEEEFALVVVPSPSEPSLLKQSPQARTSRKSMTVVEPQQAKEKTIIQREDRKRRTTVDGRATNKSVVHSKPSSSSRISSSKSYAHAERDTTIKTTSSTSVPHSEIKTLSASSARMSRSRCKSRERRRTTTTAVSSRSLAQHSHHRSRSRPSRSSSRHSHRAKEDHTVHTSKSRSKNTEITVRTQPLSVSSDEERAVATTVTTTGVSKKKEEPQQQEVLYKKRASSSRRRQSESGKSMPVTRIDFSEDKSHASSISSSSTIEESFAYSDDEKEGVGNSGDKKKRASMMLKDVKGSAVGLATRGRSTLIGLKGTSKKWQSALFM